MSDTIVIRSATVDDAARLAATIRAAFEQYRGKLEPESGAFRETAASIADELQRHTGAIVAERDGAMVGCVLFRLYEGDLYFGRLSVLPDARGLGLARRLITAVERQARLMRLPAVRLGVRVALTDNQRLFRSLGYREISREAHPGFTHPTSINMRKLLL
jgi:ribosomal protein S18 acetylase RimI-like enzyme